VLDEPNELTRFSLRNRRGAGRHEGERGFIVHEAFGNMPLGRRRAGSGEESEAQIAARLNHLMTIPWSKDTASARTCIAKSREEPLATLENVWIDLAVVLGKTSMPIHQVPQLGRGANVELDSSEPDEVRHPRQQPAGGQGHRHRQRQPHRGR
jgi:flagellar motor switch/type III secretory pathway protein FliN